MIQPWKQLGDKVDYDCGFFKVHVQRSASPLTGKDFPFYVLETHNWVNIVALTPEKKILLVNQFRHGSGQTSLEIPGGAIDAKDASPEACAKRELLEETGYEAKEWHLIGRVQPNPAILNNTCYIFLALGAYHVASLKLDEAEELEVSLENLANIPSLVQSRKIQHALVIAAFLYLDLFRKEHPNKF